MLSSIVQKDTKLISEIPDGAIQGNILIIQITKNSIHQGFKIVILIPSLVRDPNKNVFISVR
jgi:hypothetical protein